MLNKKTRIDSMCLKSINKNKEAAITFANGIILLQHKNYNKRTSRAILKSIIKRLTEGLEEFR